MKKLNTLVVYIVVSLDISNVKTIESLVHQQIFYSFDKAKKFADELVKNFPSLSCTVNKITV